MTRTLEHRGPDGEGLWIEPAAGIALGHRRLAVRDLSEAGSQPMHSPSGRWVLAFNGEVYNHEELRRSLAGEHWRGHSDTEVLAALIEKRGVEGSLPALRGMFAFAAFDTHERVLWLVRDRLGQKPLYLQAGSRELLAASELRALQADPACRTRLDRESLACIVARGYVRQPKTILDGVEQVAPGSWVRIEAEGKVTRGRWWSVEAAASETAAATYEESLDALEGALGDAVALRARADVPVGVLLSGGIDSTLIAALMVERAERVRSFTVAVEGEGFDESDDALAIARHLGTDHTTLVLDRLAVRSLAEEIAKLQDEPFGDASFVPTWLISREARRHVTVAVGGDGGDEFFGGYAHYGRALEAYDLARRVPRGIRRAGAAVGRRFERGSERAPYRVMGTHPSRTFRRVRQITSPGLAELYARCVSSTAHPDLYVMGSSGVLDPPLPRVPGHPVRALMTLDRMDFLPNDILVKTDRAGMAAGLELRAPLLDMEVVRLASTFDAEWTWDGGTGKRALRDLLAKHVPSPLWDRPKRGFAVPLADWLRGPWRPWAEDLLGPTLDGAGWWHTGPVRARWREFLAGWPNEVILWRVLQAEAWRRRGPAIT